MNSDFEVTPEVDKFREIIDQALPESIAFFGGAGVSTASGIPDFRSAKGIFNQKYPYPPETIVSHSFFMQHPDKFYEFYRSKMVFPDAAPNQAHFKLAQLEKQGKLRGIITQNIDGLHQKAGSQKVWELHGSIHRYHCLNCNSTFSLDDILNQPADSIPYCSFCHNIIRPDVVLYEEPLDPEIIQKSIETISDASILIVGGTSLEVYPAAGFLNYFKGPHLIVINKSPTPIDTRAEICLNCDISQAFNW